MDATFFATPEAFRRWLEEHHADRKELMVGFHKRATGRPSITWPQAVDEALCFGWIDGVRRRLDEDSYVVRFTPRRRRSTWSAVNIRRAEELIEEGRMAPAGLKAFELRTQANSSMYSYERTDAKLDPEQERRFRRNRRAWTYFQAQPPWYQRAAAWWVVSAKREETRRRRLDRLIEDSSEGRSIQPLSRRPST